VLKITSQVTVWMEGASAQAVCVGVGVLQGIYWEQWGNMTSRVVHAMVK
jgi:hypothetical protein